MGKCVICGESVPPSNRQRLTCSKECNRRRGIENAKRNNRKLVQKSCRVCGALFTGRAARTCCSPQCAKATFKSRSLTATCQWCGKSFVPAKPRHSTFCGRQCCFHAKGFRQRIRQASRLFVRSIARKRSPAPKRAIVRLCRICKTETPAKGKWYCLHCKADRTRECKAHNRRMYGHCRKHRQRCERFGVLYTPINPRKVFDRDRWICQLCNRKVQKAWDVNDNRSPELDHVMPLSRGGTHEWHNVQCSCRGCNGDKGSRKRGQTRLALK